MIMDNYPEHLGRYIGTRVLHENIDQCGIDYRAHVKTNKVSGPQLAEIDLPRYLIFPVDGTLETTLTHGTDYGNHAHSPGKETPQGHRFDAQGSTRFKAFDR
jgi:hypothetical protein